MFPSDNLACKGLSGKTFKGTVMTIAVAKYLAPIDEMYIFKWVIMTEPG